MIPHRSPANGMAECGSIHVEETVVKFLIGAGTVCHITNVEVEIEFTSCGDEVTAHGIVNLCLSTTSGARIPDDPEVNWCFSACYGVGFKTVAFIRLGEAIIAIVDGIVIGGVWLESGD